MARRPDIDGRQEILRAALTLFAKEGVGAVSIRAVNREAGLGAAAAHYHFGTKENLIVAVLAEHGDQVVTDICEAAEALLPNPEATAREVIGCIADAYVKLLERDGVDGLAWIRVVTELMRVDHQMIAEQRSSELMSQLIQRVFPDAPSIDVDRALQTSLALFVGQMSQIDADDLREHGVHADLRANIDFLVDFLSGGMTSALTDTPDLAVASAI